MSQSAVTLSVAFFTIVYTLSFLLTKLHIIKRPLTRSRKVSTVLIIVASSLVIAGIYLYRYSELLFILCCCAGIGIGVCKASSDILLAEASRQDNSLKMREAHESKPGTEPVLGMEESVQPAYAGIGEHASAAGRVEHVREKTTLNVIRSGKSLFLYPYMILTVLFFLCAATFLIAATAAAGEVLFNKASPGDIATYLRIISSLDFGSNALRGLSGAKLGAAIAAYGFAVGALSLMLALAVGALLMMHAKRCSCKRAVQPLLPGRKKGFIPCAEGIYKVCYQNFTPGTSFYCLYPWENLSLYEVQDRRKRIILKAGKMQIPLVLRGGLSGLYEEAKSVIFRHLPRERQSLPAKKDRYHWGKAAAAVLLIIILQIVFSSWLENSTMKAAGKRDCDAGGVIHYSYKKAFSQVRYTYKVYDQDSKKVVHTYCELHGAIFVILHPALHIRSLSELIWENRFQEITDDPILVFDMLVIPALAWLFLAAIVVYAGKPRVSRHNRL